MLNQLFEAIINSLEEMLGSSIKAIPGVLTAIAIIFLTRHLAKLVEKIAANAGKRTLHSQSLQLLLIKTCLVTTWVIGILLAGVIAFPGFDLRDIISTLGLGSVAIGFAFQDIFKNFLAGILLLIEEPFRIGDEVIIESYQGRVEHIDIRTTQIRTYDGQLVLLPNSTVFTNAVQVKTAYVSRRTDLAVGVDYNTSLPDTVKLLNKTIKNVDGVLLNPEPEIDLVNFGESSIDFMVRYWTLPEEKEVRRIHTQAIIAIKKAFTLENINIPYPIRTVYNYKQTAEVES
jgi:small-conductance mechanosensitive channel